MTSKLHFNFSHKFNGVVWNTIAHPENDVILLEIRDHEKKQVSFSALNYRINEFLWVDKKLEESWWIGLTAAAKGIILFTIYLDTQNPDKKGVLAFSLKDLQLLWWNNDFSVTALENDFVLGSSSRFGAKQSVLDLATGREVILPQGKIEGEAVKKLVRPSLYEEGTPYFETVRTFLNTKFNLSPVTALEYLEFNKLIFISYYVMENGLANYLLVLSVDGEVLLEEKTDEQLKGIGLDTFFILSGYVFFVKQKTELVSYKSI